DCRGSSYVGNKLHSDRPREKSRRCIDARRLVCPLRANAKRQHRNLLHDAFSRQKKCCPKIRQGEKCSRKLTHVVGLGHDYRKSETTCWNRLLSKEPRR